MERGGTTHKAAAAQLACNSDWVLLRERLAKAAREIHLVAIAGDAANAPALLAVAENLAGLASAMPAGAPDGVETD
jgi:hypothetical protein